MNTVKVVFDIPINQEFDYLPGKFEGLLSVGARVLAPFGRQRKMGWVAGLGRAEEPARECKTILKVYDRESLLTPELIELSAVVAQRCFCSTGQVLAAINKRLALQGGSKKREEEPLPADSPPEEIAPLPPAIAPEGFREYIVLGGGPKERLDLYLSAAAAFQGGSVLFIFPEVGRAEEFHRRLRRYAGERAVLFHGGLSRTAKTAAWERMLREGNLLVAGSRIAVFSPLTDLRAVCADHAWDTSYREQQVPHYQAVDLAGWRARRRGVPFLIGETVLSVDEYQRVRSGEATCVAAARAAGIRPAVYCLPLSGTFRDKSLPFFTRDAVSLLEETLVKGGRVMLIHNRKGTTRLLVCGKCDHRLVCESCGASLVLSAAGRHVQCAQCEVTLPVPRVCPRCGARKVSAKGYGVDRIKKLLEMHYPGVRVAKQTADEKAVVLPADTRIVLGTQAAVRLLDRFQPDLAVIVSADAFLSLPDFRAEEKFFLFVQELMAALDRPGVRLLIQASDPELPVFRSLRNDTAEKFYEKEAALRKQSGYPPFGLVLKVEIEAAQKATLEKKKGLADAFLSEHNLPVAFSGPGAPRNKKRQGWKYILKTDFFDKVKALGGLNAVVSCSITLNPDAL